MKLLIRILLWLTSRYYKLEYRIGKRADIEQWLFDSYKQPGAIDYLKVEELKVLKNMARGLTQEEYWKEVGKRRQLMLLVDDMQRTFQLRGVREKQLNEKEQKNENIGN